MQLWNGPLTTFIREAESRAIAPLMARAFADYHGYQPDLSEYASWNNSLDALARAAEPAGNKDIGVVIEYHLPFSHRRISAVAVSHPHYYTTMVSWSHAFGKVPVHVHKLDAKWVMRPDEVVKYWE